MPFNKPYRKYGRSSRRGAYKRRGYTKSMSKHMTAGRVKRIIDAELKMHDVSANNIALDNLIGLQTSLSNIAQGDQNTQRTGNWIKPISLMGTMTIIGVDGLAVEASKVRVSIVCWKENQDTDPIVLARILQDVSRPHQQYNVESKGSFKILWSRVFNVVNQDNNPQFLRTFRFYVKPSMKVLFDDADQRKYHLFLVASSDKAALSGDEPLISFDTRLRYTDS